MMITVRRGAIADIIAAPELWANSLFPEGQIEKWLLPDGALVRAGDPVAMVRIEDMLHELPAPAGGRLRVDLKDGSMIDPGQVIGQIA